MIDAHALAGGSHALASSLDRGSHARRAPAIAALALLLGASTQLGCTVAEESEHEPLCSPFQDLAPQDTVAIRITNNRDSALYVDTYCSFDLNFEIAGVLHKGGVGVREATCGTAQKDWVPCCDCSAEGEPIAPGATLETSWGGLFYAATTTMPYECYARDATLPCFLTTAAPKGPMKLVASVFATRGSNNFGYPSNPVPAEKDFVYGEDSVVEIVVE